MSTTPYFLLHAVEIQDGVAQVDGRLGELPVSIGHVFSRSFGSHQDWRGRQGAQPCALVINQIESYQQSLSTLSPGMTARLSLAGSHISVLKSAEVIE